MGTGYHEDGLVQASQPIELGMNGQRHLQVTVNDNVSSLIYAWQQMQPYKRLLRWAWTSRGLVTEAEMMELHPGLSKEDLHSGDADAGIPFKELIPGVPVLVPILGCSPVQCF